MDVDIAKRFTQAVYDLSRDRHISRFLVDVRSAPNVSGVLDNYRFAYEDMKDFDFPRNARAAILIAMGDESHNFVETASQNAGRDVRVFDDEEAATAWLEVGTSR